MLRKTEQGWAFGEERLLEDFVWDSLDDLDLIPIKRQFGINGEYCDILAKTKNNQLVVLELKNNDDRYIIHQLTRYYHGLKTTKPFKDSVDYNQPIRLIAITPDFHKHNFIDRRYNLLQFEFIRFEILNQTNNFYLHFHLEGRKELTISKPIPFIEAGKTLLQSQSDIDVLTPPRMLINKLDQLTPLAKIEILQLREKMLGSNKRIKEIKETRSLFYGRGKTKPCCQFKLVLPSKSNQFQFSKISQVYEFQCYLWLPVPQCLPNFANKSSIGRMYLDFEPNFQYVKSISYWSLNNRQPSFELPMPTEKYFDEIGLDNSNTSIDQLFELAIKINLERS